MSREHRTPAKKHLEYWPEPTSLRSRNRPEMRDAALPETPGAWLAELGSKRSVAQAGQKSESWIAKAGFIFRSFIGLARIGINNRVHDRGLRRLRKPPVELLAEGRDVQR